MRILALDWGEVRIGAAVSDPEGKIAFPLEKFIESKNGIIEIKKLVESLGVGKILLGLPKAMAGTDSHSTEKVRQFADRLKRQISIEIDLFDERLSSVGAHRALAQLGLSEREQRTEVDNVVAQQMLQTYLDNK